MQALIRTSSARLAAEWEAADRQASSGATAGTAQGTSAEGIAGDAIEAPPPSETQPLLARSASRRLEEQALFRERGMQDLQENLHRLGRYLALLGFLGVIVMVTGCFLLFRALVAALYNQDKPCDQWLLKYYIFLQLALSIVVNRLSSGVVGYMRQAFPARPSMAVIGVFCCSLPGIALIAYGLHMVHESKTCAKTNPDLFDPTVTYIHAQIVFVAMALVCSLVLAVGVRHLVLAVCRFENGPGCAKAVENLPRVPAGSPELFDGTEARDCPICLDSLTKVDSDDKLSLGEAVRCPCNHLFHLQCLSTWCKNHLDCPLCRQAISVPEPQVEQV